MDFETVPKMTVPFAELGDCADISNNNDVGRAGWNTGFPVETQIDQPPFRIDFNGVLKRMSQGVVSYFAGKLFKFDAGFSTAVGGYPQNALLASANNLHLWLSTITGNTANPDTGGANWLDLSNASTLEGYHAAAFALLANFDVLLQPIGYLRLPAINPAFPNQRLIIQWGMVLNIAANNIPHEVFLPIAFPNLFFQAYAVAMGSSETAGSFGTNPGTSNGLSSINIFNPSNIAQNVRWLAIGF
jgi:hypothetical protein